MGTDPMIFLTRVTVPFIFGTIIVLNMLQNSLFAKMTQPVKGAGQRHRGDRHRPGAVPRLRRAGANGHRRDLASGPPGYEFEIWLANALLSVTFPFLIFVAAYFAFWPLARPAK